MWSIRHGSLSSSGALRPLHPRLHPHCLLSLAHQLPGGGEGALASWRHPAGGDPEELQSCLRLPAALWCHRPPWGSGGWAGRRRRRRRSGGPRPGSTAGRRGGGGDDCGDVWQQLGAGEQTSSFSSHTADHLKKVGEQFQSILNTILTEHTYSCTTRQWDHNPATRSCDSTDSGQAHGGLFWMRHDEGACVVARILLSCRLSTLHSSGGCTFVYVRCQVCDCKSTQTPPCLLLDARPGIINIIFAIVHGGALSGPARLGPVK